MPISERGIVEIIANNVSTIRKSKKISFQELSYRTGIDKSNLIGICNNGTNFTIITLLKLAKALEVDIKDFFKDINLEEIDC